MIFYLDKPSITWNHVRMLIHECRNNETIAKAAVDGIQNEFILSIRRRAVAEDDGKIRFVDQVKKIERSWEGETDRITPDVDTVITDMATQFASFNEKFMTSLKKAWRVLWP